MTATIQPLSTNQRIEVLDILRGIALFGMIIAHFAGDEVNTTADTITDNLITWFVYDRFHTIFAILFGAGFAIQFTRAKINNERFVPRYLRRLLALFVFGFIAEVGFGFSILIEYSFCALLLLIVRKWSIRTLVIILLICVISSQLNKAIRTGIYISTHTVEQLKERQTELQKEARKNWKQHQELERVEKSTTNFLTAVDIRVHKLIDRIHKLLNYFVSLIYDDLVFFLIGFLAMRIKIFERPLQYRRLLLCLMGVGIISLVAAHWFLPLIYRNGLHYYPDVSLFNETLNSILRWAIFRDTWLSFTYIGAILLLAAYHPVWINRLRFFGWAGRMALTNYMLQAFIISLLIYNYAVAVLPIPQRFVPLLSVLFFGLLVLFSKWWLTKFQYGPLEWVWRTLTYWKWQPMKKKEIVESIELDQKEKFIIN